MGSALGGQVTIGLVNTIFTLVAIWKVDHFGRKPLLLAGIAGLVLTLSMVSTLFAQGVQGGVALMACFMVYCACFAASLGPIPWIVISEIFPTRIRGRAMSIGTFSIWAACGVVAQTFPWLEEHAGPSLTFYLYALLLAPALLFVWLVVPETKGKSLEQIEKDWHRG
jgi:SP family arabinose:H+ symporter-like MFS transporter